MVILALFSGSARAQTQKIINTESFSDADTVVVGRMGVPLGKVVEIEAIVVSGDSLKMKGYAGAYLLKVISVKTDTLMGKPWNKGTITLEKMPLYEFSMHPFADGNVKLASDSFALYKIKKGKDTGTLTSDEVRELEKDYVGRKFTLLAYETGAFGGIPKEMPEDFLSWQDTGFGFRSHLLVMRVLKEWPVSEERERAKEMQGVEKQNAETNRAFQMEASADVEVYYESPDRISLSLPGGKDSAFITHDRLGAAIAGATDKREMAVVIMGPPMRMHSDETFRKEVDEIERIIKAQGFKRVVFMLASAFGMPIYRE